LRREAKPFFQVEKAGKINYRNHRLYIDAYCKLRYGTTVRALLEAVCSDPSPFGARQEGNNAGISSLASSFGCSHNYKRNGWAMSQKQIAMECPPANEGKYIADLAQRLQAKITDQYRTGIMRRDAHPKMHGVVKAEFTVEPNLPDDLRVGIFREAKTYQAWIRYSNQNSNIQADIKGDIRGMAIKLMGVPGQKLQELEPNQPTHDFITISTNVFVTHDAQEFDGLVKALISGMLPMVWFFLWHPRSLWNLMAASKKVANPLQIRYWSTTPYLFGNGAAVKYSAMPQAPATDTVPSNPSDDFLREAMVRQLSKGGVKFDFAVQFQKNADTMPIEDPGKAWSEEESPFRKVATIHIPQQEFDSDAQRTFGENLSFTPWHCLPEHRPLGGINRARRVVYDAISKFRHQCNHVPRNEPTSWAVIDIPDQRDQPAATSASTTNPA
jgi:catalase